MEKIFRWNSFVWISIGAVPAAIFRWQIDENFTANIIGCFLLGFINSLNINKKYKLLFGFGFCGALTTFSGWSFQLFELLNQGFYKLFLLNSIMLVIVSLLAMSLGYLFARKIIN